MKIGMRTPSLKKSIKAKTTGKAKRTLKKSINPTYGKKGMGLINNPKKAVYNKAYNKTTLNSAGLSTHKQTSSTRGHSNINNSSREYEAVQVVDNRPKELRLLDLPQYRELIENHSMDYMLENEKGLYERWDEVNPMRRIKVRPIRILAYITYWLLAGALASTPLVFVSIIMTIYMIVVGLRSKEVKRAIEDNKIAMEAKEVLAGIEKLEKIEKESNSITVTCSSCTATFDVIRGMNKKCEYCGTIVTTE